MGQCQEFRREESVPGSSSLFCSWSSSFAWLVDFVETCHCCCRHRCDRGVVVLVVVGGGGLLFKV